jgi:hypothetical protein
MRRDWGGLRRKILMVRPRIVMYPRRMIGIEDGGVGRGAERTRDIGVRIPKGTMVCCSVRKTVRLEIEDKMLLDDT